MLLICFGIIAASLSPGGMTVVECKCLPRNETGFYPFQHGTD
jgi:hypothetical protein